MGTVSVCRTVLSFGSMVRGVHPSSDELEAYSLRLSSDADLEIVEEHLLVCEGCQNELALTDLYVRAIKNAALTANRKAAQVNPHHRRRSSIRSDAQ